MVLSGSVGQGKKEEEGNKDAVLGCPLVATSCMTLTTQESQLRCLSWSEQGGLLPACRDPMPRESESQLLNPEKGILS